ncbi:MAG: SIS domain-containing protein [Syntrophomonas sp.]
MKQYVKKILEQTIINYPLLEKCRDSIIEAFLIIKKCYCEGGKVLICGNGGSAADCEHIVAELMKGFLLKRPITSVDAEKIRTAFPEEGIYLTENLQGALPAISLVSQYSLYTALVNDVQADMVYAQQVFGYAREGDVLIGISTSGNSQNVVNAIKVAQAFNITTIGITGETNGTIKKFCDCIIEVPATQTSRIQELHMPVYHTLCAMLEAHFFEE